MKSRRNLTRFTYETTAFQGWRLCIQRGGKSFLRYFSDREYGGPRKSLEAAEAKLAELKGHLAHAKRVRGKLAPAAARKAEQILRGEP